MPRGGKRAGAGRKPSAKPAMREQAVTPPSPAVVKALAADDITLERTLRELARIGFADIRDVVNWLAKPTGVDEDTGEIQVSNEINVIDSASLPPDIAAAISELSQSRFGALKIKLHPKLPALAQLLRHLAAAKPANAAEESKPAEVAPKPSRFAPRPPPTLMRH